MIGIFPTTFKRFSHSLVTMLVLHHCAFAQVTFMNVAGSAGIDHYVNPHPYAQQRTGGVAWFDFNNDGWEDLYLTGAGNGDKLYQNLGNGQFTDVSISSGISAETISIITLGVAAGDLNRDGLEDLVVTTDVSDRNLVFMNDGAGIFSEQSLFLGVIDTSFSFGISMADYNRDGWLDLYFSNWLDNPLFETAYPDRLYQNNGDGSFTDVTEALGLYSNKGVGTASCFSDFDSDGDLDLFVVNDYGILFWTDANRLFENEVFGFNDISGSSGANLEIFGFGIASGDYDEDGDYDYYLTKIGSNVLLRNDMGTFSDQAAVAGIESHWNVIDSAAASVFTQGMSWGNSFFDYDNDTYLDLFVSNGRLPLDGEEQVTIDENRLFRNLNASGNFSDESIVVGMNHGLANKGCAVADYDHDGDQDMVIVTSDTVGGSGRTLVMNNQGGNLLNWVELGLVGVNSNLEAIGATVKVHFNGRVLMRQVDGGGGSYLSHHSKVQHFGLGQNQLVDSVSVLWPSGLTEVFSNVSINQRSQLVEGTGVIITRKSELDDRSLLLSPNPTSSFVQFQTTLPDVTALVIVDMTGKQCIAKSIMCSERCMLDLSLLANGMYAVILYDRNGGQLSVGKLQVTKEH